MPIHQIKITIDTNIPNGKPVVLTRNMFVLPKTEDSEDDEDDSSISQYPYFLSDVVYSYDKLKVLPRAMQINVFFKKKLFIDTIGITTPELDPNKIHENTKKNVRTMLLILFPTVYPVEDNFHNSFTEVILKEKTNVVEDYNIIPKFVTNWFKSKDAKMCHLKFNGETYTVIEVTWINDIINNETFRTLFKQLIAFKLLLKKIQEKFTREINSDTQRFLSLYHRDQIFTSDSQKNINTDLEEIKKYFSRYPSPGVNIELIKRTFDELYTNNDIPTIIKLLNTIYNSEKKTSKTSIIPSSLQSNAEFMKLLKLAHKIVFMKYILENYLEQLNAYLKLISITSKQDKENLTSSELEVYDFFTGNSEYSKLSNIVSLVKPFSSKKSSNPKLYKLFEEYKTHPNELLKFAEYVHGFEQNKLKSGEFSTDMLELGTVLITETGEKDKDKDKEKVEIQSTTPDKEFYEVTIKLNLLKGLLTANIIQNIRCMLGNILLIQRYNKNKMTGHSENPFILPTRKFPLIDINILNKKVTVDKSLKQASTNKKSPPIISRNNTTISNRPEAMKGGFKLHSVQSKKKSTKKKKYTIVNSMKSFMIGGFQTVSHSPNTKTKRRTKSRK